MQGLVFKKPGTLKKVEGGIRKNEKVCKVENTFWGHTHGPGKKVVTLKRCQKRKLTKGKPFRRNILPCGKKRIAVEWEKKADPEDTRKPLQQERGRVLPKRTWQGDSPESTIKANCGKGVKEKSI